MNGPIFPSIDVNRFLNNSRTFNYEKMSSLKLKLNSSMNTSLCKTPPRLINFYIYYILCCLNFFPKKKLTNLQRVKN